MKKKEDVKVIFLDFDGVITTKRSGYRIDYDKIDLLDLIINKTNAKLVISSSWRSYDLESTIVDLRKNGFPKYLCDRIIGITPRTYGYIYRDIINDERASIDIPRGCEIDYWMEHTDYNVINYVILDDDTDMLYYQRNNFIQTDTYDGMSEENALNAINILNRM